jgi:hypothetical protein
LTPRRLAAIRARRERLVARAAVQRDDVALALGVLRAPLAVVDRGVAGVTYVRDRPALVFAAAVVLVVLSPRRAWRWGRRAFVLWRGYRTVVAFVDKRMPKQRDPLAPL